MMMRIFGHYVPVALLALGAIEVGVLLGAFYLSVFLRWAATDDLAGEFVRFLPEAGLYVGVTLLSMVALGLYQRETIGDVRTTIVRLLATMALAFVALAVVFYVYPPVIIWRSAVAIAMPLSVVGILAVRRAFLWCVSLKSFRRRILILGAGTRAAQIATYEETGRHHHGFAAVGYLRLQEGENEVDGSRSLDELGSLLDYAREHQVEEIVVAAQERRGSLPVRALLDCKLHGIRVTDYTAFWERETGRVDLNRLDPSWLVFSEWFGGGRLHRALKRAFDVTVALAVLVLAAPLLAVTALAVRLESRGPVLYRQARVGLDGRPYELLKFRSMRADAEADGVPQWAAQGDPRVTRVGRVIRRTRIDELPQVLNVLRGDMSVVGPRPERPYFVERLGEQIPFYPDRHRVKPGIGGWAQLNYPYGASVEDARRKLEYDLYYVKNCSVFLDLLILLQTLRVVIWPHGVR